MTLFTLAWTGIVLYWTSTLNIGDDPLKVALEVTPPSPIDEPIIQKFPPPKVRFTVEQEMDMACAEVDCVKKCSAAYQEKKEKFDACRKTCAKDRCKQRCKNEPNPSYVERELKREKCLDNCRDKDEKCKKSCEEEARRCKDRCKERAQRYFCVRDLDKLGQEDDVAFDPAQFLDENAPI